MARRRSRSPRGSTRYWDDMAARVVFLRSKSPAGGEPPTDHEGGGSPGGSGVARPGAAPPPRREAEGLEHLRGPRVDGEHDLEPRPAGDPLEPVEGRREGTRAVHVLLAVEREEDVLALREPEVPEDRRACLRGPDVLGQGVDHAVPDDVDAAGHVLPPQVRPRGLRRREEMVREMVRDGPVDLLRHRAVEGPDPRLHVGEGLCLLVREDGPSEGRVRVPVDDDEVRGGGHGRDLSDRRRDLGGGRAVLELELVVGGP